MTPAKRTDTNTPKSMFSISMAVMSNRSSVPTHLSAGMEGGSLPRNSSPTVLRTFLAVAGWATFRGLASLCGLSSLSGPSSLLVPLSQVPSAHPFGTCQCLRHSDKSNKSSFWVSGCGRKVRSIGGPGRLLHRCNTCYIDSLLANDIADIAASAVHALS